jgi:hypothetical protein
MRLTTSSVNGDNVEKLKPRSNLSGCSAKEGGGGGEEEEEEEKKKCCHLSLKKS